MIQRIVDKLILVYTVLCVWIVRDVNGNGVCQEMEEVPVGYVMEGGKES